MHLSIEPESELCKSHKQEDNLLECRPLGWLFQLVGSGLSYITHPYAQLRLFDFDWACDGENYARQLAAECAVAFLTLQLIYLTHISFIIDKISPHEILYTRLEIILAS